MSRRGVVAVVVVLAMAVLALALADRDGADRSAFRPGSVGPLGYQGLVRLVESLGADVDESVPIRRDLSDSVDVLVVTEHPADDAIEADLAAFVTAGGVLVVLDPTSPLLPSGVPGVQASAESSCEVPAFDGIRRLSALEQVFFAAEHPFVGCFGAPGVGFAVVVDESSAGTIVGVAPTIFVNDSLFRADNAVLATALLVPSDGTRVGFASRTSVVGGDRSLSSLIDEGFKWALVQLVVAMALVMWWRSRRLGHPVPETQLVTLEGSDLVEAAGALWQRGGRSNEAARRLHADLVSGTLAPLGHRADRYDAAEIAARSGLDVAVVVRALTPEAVSDDRELVEYADAVVAIRDRLGRRGEPTRPSALKGSSR